MTNTLTTFTFHTAAIRMVEIDGNPWFAAIDVCRALGMDVSKAGAAPWLNRVLPSERVRVSRKEYPHVFADGRGQSLTLISESALYKVTIRSNKPEARAFEDWETGEVLPSIRKTGAYGVAKAGTEGVAEAGGMAAEQENCNGVAPGARLKPLERQAFEWTRKNLKKSGTSSTRSYTSRLS